MDNDSLKRLLDSNETFRKEPYGKAFGIIDDFVDYLKKGFELGSKVSIEVPRIRSVIFTGMGGSGIIGDVVADFLAGKDVEIRVQKDYFIARGEYDLAVVVSHSGNTAETINSLIELLQRNADQKLVVITSDGILKRIAEKIGAPLITVRGDIPPRYGFPEMLGAALGLLSSLGIIEFHVNEEELEGFQSKLKCDVPYEENLAKQVAAKITQFYPVIYCPRYLKAVGWRLKSQLNENSKIYCSYAELPEALHNDIEALTKDSLVIIPRSFREPKELTYTINALVEILGGDRFVFLKAESMYLVNETIKLIILCDYISLYAAVIKKVNPMQVPLISRLKKINETPKMIYNKASRIFFGVEKN